MAYDNDLWRFDKIFSGCHPSQFQLRPYYKDLIVTANPGGEDGAGI